jgi:hypothetical protein
MTSTATSNDSAAEIEPGTLRARLQTLSSTKTLLNAKQAVGIVVPLCVEIAELHRNGTALFVYPSSLVEDDYGFYHVSPDLAQLPPTHKRDKACLAPEERSGQPGMARASVYAMGAILYELLTGESVGPGMRRPSELVPAVPQELELVLAKALVGDPAHRPDDLNALAQALYNAAPSGSIRPPAADTSHLDDLAVDVSMSMMPPPPPNLQGSPYDLIIKEAPPPSAPVSDQTNELAQLKARLESDPRPRYVIVKDGMDHGPFSAVELLLQIASHTFVENDILRDTLSGDEREIREWPEFSPFAEHSRIHRDIKAEKAAIERVVVQEARSTRGKAFIGLGVVGALVVLAGVWFVTARGMRSDDIEVHGDKVSSVDIDGGLAAAKRAGGAGRRSGAGSGAFPTLAGGMSCEQAQASYVDEMNIGGKKGPADLTANQYGSILNRGTYFGHCGVPDTMGLNICAAVQNGRAVGVTVTSNPRDPRVQACVSNAVRGLRFPSHPKLDVTRTSF